MNFFIHNGDGFVVNGNCQMIRKSLIIGGGRLESDVNDD